MSDFNKNGREEEFDESIDFMMKKRKETVRTESTGAKKSLSSDGDVKVFERRNSAARAGALQNGAAQSAGAARGAVPARGETGLGRPMAQSGAGNGTVSRPAAQNGTGASNMGRSASQNGVANSRSTAQSAGNAGRPVGTGAVSAAGGVKRVAAQSGAGSVPQSGIPSAQNGAPQAQNTTKAEFVTSGQRIVPAGKNAAGASGAKRPITIKRTSDIVDNQATRKTDISEKVGAKNGKARDTRGKKESRDIGSGLVISMVCAVIYLVVVAVISAVLSVFIINVGNDMYAFVKSDEIVEVTIPENATTKDVAEILYQNGVIKYKGVFEFYGKIKDIEENYVAGDYSVSPMMNYKALFYEFKPKKVSGTSWVTIPEGYTVDEIIDLLLSYGIGGTKEDYVDAINNGEFDYWFVEELETNGWSEDRFYRLEGYLFPDTYEFYNASDAYTVVNKMLRRFSEVYTEAYRARAVEIGFTTDQVVTLASMIEKEAGFSSDFRNVSSVFHNRLNNSGTYPRLESDATVVYAIHHLTGERPTDVTGETISYVSPYNTYQNNGLPPGAIANPGMNALKYALYPADTNYYFFVSSKSGTTLFATNAAGHEANKQSIKNEQ